jgi:protease II
MRELCPYQNIKTAEYPPVLATCSVTDPRVPVWGPAKWVAKLRQHQIGPSPILLLSTSDTGHYAHEADLLENSALEYAFLIDAFQKKHHTNAKQTAMGPS